MEGKTPVSALQEYMMGMQKRAPTYELMSQNSQAGTHKPEFVIRVHANGSWREGKGKSKQEAKHRAAENMLKDLNVTDINNVWIPVSHSSVNSDEDYVSTLKEYCLLRPYPLPVYKMEEEAGPPHLRTFKMTCFVSQLHESGIGRTKKMAKQMAAHYMLEKLKKLNLEKNNNSESKSESCLKKTIVEIPQIKLMSEDNVQNNCNISKSASQSNQRDRFVYYKDHYKAYVGLQKNSVTLLKILQHNSLVTVWSAEKLLDEITEELGASLSSVKDQVKSGSEYIFMAMASRESEWPTLASVGATKESAAENLLKSLIVLSSE